MALLLHEFIRFSQASQDIQPPFLETFREHMRLVWQDRRTYRCIRNVQTRSTHHPQLVKIQS